MSDTTSVQKETKQTPEEIALIHIGNAKTMAEIQRRTNKIHPLWGYVSRARDELQDAYRACDYRDLDDVIAAIRQAEIFIKKANDLAEKLKKDPDFI